MNKILRWLGTILGVLIAVLAVAAIGVFALTETRANRVYEFEVAAIEVPTHAASIARGQHLVEVVGDCTGCHGDNLAGKPMINDPMIAVVHSANLTSGEGGAANLTPEEFVRAFRHGVGQDGKPLWIMPAGEFKFSDSDLGAAMAFLRSVPPVDNVEPEPRAGPLGRVLVALNVLPAWPVEAMDHDEPAPEMVPEGVTVEYGAYLAGLAACAACHSADYSGGPVPGEAPDSPTARNLTPASEMAGWTLDHFITTLRTGVNPANHTLSEIMPWKAYGQMTDDELEAIFMYLKTLPAVESEY